MVLDGGDPRAGPHGPAGSVAGVTRSLQSADWRRLYAANAVATSFVGMTLNGVWRIDALLGTGGMGQVYRARQLTLDRDVAVKLLHPRDASSERDPAFRQRFFLEASECAKLSHPNLVTVYEYGRVEGVEPETLFIAMELLAGETLHHRLRRTPTLPLADALRIVGETARGLREAHRNGLVHRDLKPGNLMLVPGDDGERVKVLDFGLVKRVFAGPDDQELTQQGSFLGSPKYISPEQVMGTPVDHRADLYALGIILYECLTGVVPFRGDTGVQTMMSRVTTQAPRRAAAVGEGVFPESVERLVASLLARDPEGRYADATAALRALRELQAELGIVVGGGSGEWSSSGRAVMGVSPAGPVLPLSNSPPPIIRGAVSAATPPDGARRRRAWLVAPLLFGLAVLAGVGLAKRPDATTAPRSSLAPPAAPPPSALPPPAPPPPAPPPPSPPSASAPTVATPPEVRDRARDHHVASRHRAVPPAPVAAATAPAPAPPGDGFVSVDTTPWTEVTVDGVSLGHTPLMRARVASGTRRFTFRNRELGINVSRMIDVPPGESLTRRFTFD